MTKTDKKKIKDILMRGVADVVQKEPLQKKLESGKSLRIKHGVDPTTPDLHLGYYVVYKKMRDLQQMGHKIVFLIGDFTARFGDPTGKMDARNHRTKEEVRNMAKSYIEQAGKILDMKKTEIRHNSEWYDSMELDDFFRVAERFSVWRILERDLFQKRKEQEKELRISEFLYPVLQAYDSVMLESDATVIGSDQLFNELQARSLQTFYNQKPQDIIAMELLVGLDGSKKMSQSLGNYIGITESAREKFGKIMSIPDKLMMHYWELLTSKPLDELASIKEDLKKDKKHPRDIKMELAQRIVEEIDGEKAAKKAKEYFIKVFQDKKLPENVREIHTKEGETIREILKKAKLVNSFGQADRLVAQGAVSINDKKIKDSYEKPELDKEKILKVGKHRFVKLVPKQG